MRGKLIASRQGYNALTTEPKNLAFSSEFELNKIAKIKGFTANGSVNHGFNYAPKFLAMKEISNSPLKIGWGGIGSVDNQKIYATIGSHTTNFSWDNPVSADDSGEWVIIFADNLSNGSFKKTIKGPIITVGYGDNDYNYKIHSAYDTFKVFHTGRLTVNAPEFDNGEGGGVQITTATYNHNLGYCPFFGPFVDYEICKEFYYSWNGQYNSNNTWTAGIIYHIGEDVWLEDTGEWFTCKVTHTASNSNRPTTGAEWTTYWELTPEIDFYNTYLNKLEDQKVIYGGYAEYNQSYFLYYVTTTQLVLQLVQSQAPDVWLEGDPPYLEYEHTPCPAETVYVDYTIFYNKINEELDLISD